MASKNKIIVHIGDELLYSVIKNEIEGTGEKKSEFVRRILEEKLSAKISEKRGLLNSMYSPERNTDAVSVYPLNITIDSERQVTKDGVLRLNKVDEILYDDYESVFFGMMSFTLNQIKKTVRDEAVKRIPEAIKRAWSSIESQYDSADINLVFVNRVDISFLENKDNKFYVRIKIHFHVSRFLFSAVDWIDDFLRIDFLNIKYLRFKYVAVNGCLPKKYYRWLYLKPTKETMLGGFFAGLLYTPKKKEVLIKEIEQLLSSQDFCKNGMLEIPGKFVKVHINSEQIKVDGRSFSDGFNMLEQRRQMHSVGAVNPPWLK
ncbi:MULTISPECIES: hypothetical protein [Enterobacteriaceae]|uniref:Uncharacterized protein n=1 Tax=Enterobacter cloacae TaxID=550 RepID=A0A330GCM8_ENTCL|nr:MULTISPECIES: hypothetical protein [Enterobacteriaceae]HDS2235523.1 hypothetical protein [Klebsiella michiganensis]HED1507603.1 hypothetical protein [Raoultella ornithinolytica]MDG9852044.1 hypothetical protein [Klebsiella grimontii]MDG9965722.1 hypothetical protein [Klebsiella grimontii]RAZ62484.1 hypothetical protein DP202_23335 [Enterobacter cloacae]